LKFEDKHSPLLSALLGNLNPYKKYINDPVGFCKDVLGVTLWDKQAEIFKALIEHRQVLVKSANSVGKTKLAACVAEWFHLVYETGECVITGPRAEQLDDTTFKEIRLLHGNRPGMLPRSSRIETSPDHYIKGTTAKDGNAFQGIHSKNICLIFEECTGVEAQFWEAARGILAGGNTFWLAICNPTDNSSQAFIEEQSGQWEVFEISAFDHPNIKAELQGLPAIIPSAIRLGALKSNMDAWGEWIKKKDATPSDVRFEEKGQPTKWWSPGPIGEARILGRYPSQSAYSVFGESDFVIASNSEFQDEAERFFAEIFEKVKKPDDPRAGHPARFGNDLVPQFGCDVARFGDDRTCISGRIGRYLFHHESHNGQDTEWTSSRLKQLANEWGAKFGIAPTKIPIKVDDTGLGGGVTDQRGDYYFVPINAAMVAIEELSYPNKRSEMLFNLALMMRSGDVRFPRTIDKRTVQEIKRQALSVLYKPDSRGRRVAEGKDRIKDRVNRSPDDLDSIALAFYGLYSSYTEHKTIEVESKPLVRDSRNLFGTR
jgi:hypothetical protein